MLQIIVNITQQNFLCMGGGQDKPAWTACPPGVKITRAGGKISRDSLPPRGQANRGWLAPRGASCPGGKINWDTGLSAKVWNFISTVFMRKKYFRKCYQKPLLMIEKHFKLENIGLVVLSTQFHEERHWQFPIAGNGAFRALTFVPLCRLHFWSDCNELSGTIDK